jgi:hypothetical protein
VRGTVSLATMLATVRATNGCWGCFTEQAKRRLARRLNYPVDLISIQISALVRYYSEGSSEGAGDDVPKNPGVDLY